MYQTTSIQRDGSPIAVHSLLRQEANELALKLRSFGFPDGEQLIIDEPNRKSTIELTKGENNNEILQIKAIFLYEGRSKLKEELLSKADQEVKLTPSILKGLNKTNSFIDEHRQSWAYPLEVLKTVRWMYNLQIADFAEPEISIQMDSERSFSLCSECNLRIGDIYVTPPSIIPSLLLLSKPKFEEPIAFEFLRDAQRLSGSFDKTSIILMSIALEVGVKSFLSRKNPIVGDVLMSMQSPPIHKLFEEILPKVDPSIQLDNDTCKVIRNIIQLRNELVHKGFCKDLSSRDYTDYLSLVKDVLYTLSGDIYPEGLVHRSLSRLKKK